MKSYVLELGSGNFTGESGDGNCPDPTSQIYEAKRFDSSIRLNDILNETKIGGEMRSEGHIVRAGPQELSRVPSRCTMIVWATNFGASMLNCKLCRHKSFPKSCTARVVLIELSNREIDLS
jgi:hypothetical protein